MGYIDSSSKMGLNHSCESLSLFYNLRLSSAWGVSYITQQQGVNLITSETGRPLSGRVLNYCSLHQNPRALPFLLVSLFSIWISVFSGCTFQWLVMETPALTFFCCSSIQHQMRNTTCAVLLPVSIHDIFLCVWTLHEDEIQLSNCVWDTRTY